MDKLAAGGSTIYCSGTTAHLCQLKLRLKYPGVAWPYNITFKHIEPGQSLELCYGGIDFEVHALAADHCQGAIMLLFQSAAFGTILHTGRSRNCRFEKVV